MKRAFVVIALLLLLFPALAFGHGGAWRGPGRRAPNDPTPNAGPGPGSWTTTWQLGRQVLVDLAGLRQTRVDALTTPRAPGSTAPDRGPRDRIVEALRKAALDKDKDISTGAIIALGKSAAPVAKPLLRKLLVADGVHFTVNEAAAIALGLYGDRDPETRRFLEQVTDSPRVKTRTRALCALARGFLGDPGAIPGLMALARRKSEDEEVRSSAILALGLLGDDMVLPELARALSGPLGAREGDDRMRGWYAAAIGRLRSRDAIPALLRALRDSDRDVRRQTVLSLAPIVTPEDKAAVHALERVLMTDGDQLVVGFAAIALGEIGAPVQDRLGEAYRKGPQAISAYAALGLGLLVRTGAPEEIATRIRTFLRSEFRSAGSSNLKGALVTALGIAGAVEEVPRIRFLLAGSGDPAVRAYAAVALGIIGAKEAIPELRKALEEKRKPKLQREAALALSLLVDRGAIEILMKLLDEGETEFVRGSAAVALGRIATPETSEALLEILEDESASKATRAFAAVALGLVVDPHETPVLGKIGDHLNHAMATEAILEALSLL